MRSILILCFIVLISNAYATEQQPDKLKFDGKNLDVSIGWGHPSPLETYYQQNGLKNPFRGVSTNNYRGHIASWVIKDDSLYLKSISGHLESKDPSTYGLSLHLKRKNLFIASWFNGVLESPYFVKDGKWDYERKGIYYISIVWGKVQDYKFIPEEYLDSRRNENATFNSDYEDLINLHHRYITYYYRLRQDAIRFNSESCILSTSLKRLSPILRFYDNTHFDWPYNWENSTKSGAPKGFWAIIGNKLILEKLELHSGLLIDSAFTEELNISSTLNGEETDDGLIANWVSGIYMVIHGYNEPRKDFDFLTRFVTTNYSFIRVNQGTVMEQYTVKENFNFDKPPKKTDPNLLKLLNEYFNSP